jgi:hypothetical protein
LRVVVVRCDLLGPAAEGTDDMLNAHFLAVPLSDQCIRGRLRDGPGD